jgi:hypothetical protein
VLEFIGIVAFSIGKNEIIALKRRRQAIIRELDGRNAGDLGANVADIGLLRLRREIESIDAKINVLAASGKGDTEESDETPA